SSITVVMDSTWCLEATSGTTPPKRLWLSIWLTTILDSSSCPFFTTLHAVSSQLVSILKIVMSLFIQLHPHHMCILSGSVIILTYSSIGKPFFFIQAFRCIVIDIDFER